MCLPLLYGWTSPYDLCFYPGLRIGIKTNDGWLDLKWPWLRRCSDATFLRVWKPNNELHWTSFYGGRSHAQSSPLLGTKALFPHLSGVLGGVSPQLPALFADCLGFRKTASTKITCPFRAGLQPMTNKWASIKAWLPRLNSGQLWKAINLQDDPVGTAEAFVGPASNQTSQSSFLPHFPQVLILKARPDKEVVCWLL